MVILRGAFLMLASTAWETLGYPWRPCQRGGWEPCCNPYARVAEYCPGRIPCEECGTNKCQCQRRTSPGGHRRHTTRTTTPPTRPTPSPPTPTPPIPSPSPAPPTPPPSPTLPPPTPSPPTPSPPSPPTSPSPPVPPSPPGEEPNPPVWPDTVKVFGPDEEAAAQRAVLEAFSFNGGHEPPDHGQFSDKRFAFLFKPGHYNVEVPVGFYTQVAGLGESPADVVFTSSKGVYADEAAYEPDRGACDTFWRAAENFENRAHERWFVGGFSGMLWAASQSAPVRRIIATNDMILFRYRTGESADYASGGFLANSVIKGEVKSGSQQQYFARNNDLQRGWDVGNWNMVFVGVKGAPPSHCGRGGPRDPPNAFTTVPHTPVIAEKPFVSITAAGKFKLNIPKLRFKVQGVDFDPGKQVDFKDVYVTRLNDTAASINAKLKQGLHVVISAGIYNLDEPLVLSTKGQVLLGIGLPSLHAATGKTLIKVGDVDGVRIAGILLEGGTIESPVLLEWGSGSYAGKASDPGFLFDVFVRVGGRHECNNGPQDAKAHTLMRINNGHVIGDDVWLWRADHTGGFLQNVKNGACPVQVGLDVNGDDVTMYGLAVEHTLQDQVRWQGERGATYFFQSETPYDANQTFGDNYVGYRVAPNIKQHKGYGLGVYHVFFDHPVVMKTGIIVPKILESSIVAPLGVYVNGQGKMLHILNDHGDMTQKGGRNGAVVAWYCGGVDVGENTTLSENSLLI